jgi:hypothetical protein
MDGAITKWAWNSFISQLTTSQAYLSECSSLSLSVRECFRIALELFGFFERIPLNCKYWVSWITLIYSAIYWCCRGFLDVIDDSSSHACFPCWQSWQWVNVTLKRSTYRWSETLYVADIQLCTALRTNSYTAAMQAQHPYSTQGWMTCASCNSYCDQWPALRRSRLFS